MHAGRTGRLGPTKSKQQRMQAATWFSTTSQYANAGNVSKQTILDIVQQERNETMQMLRQETMQILQA
jgi:hypothetical protein